MKDTYFWQMSVQQQQKEQLLSIHSVFSLEVFFFKAPWYLQKLRNSAPVGEERRGDSEAVRVRSEGDALLSLHRTALFSQRTSPAGEMHSLRSPPLAHSQLHTARPKRLFDHWAAGAGLMVFKDGVVTKELINSPFGRAPWRLLRCSTEEETPQSRRLIWRWTDHTMNLGLNNATQTTL